MYGLYPPSTGPRLNWADRKWHLPPYSYKNDSVEQNYAFPNGYQPIKVKTNQKILISNCPRWDNFSQINFQEISDVVEEMKTTYNPFMQKIANMLNFTLTNDSLYQMLRAYDVINVDKHLGRSLPEGFTDDDWLNLRHFANWYYLVAEKKNNTQMINTGKISKIFSAFDTRTKIPSSYALKATFMSVHDTDILAMYLGLNISSADCTE